MRATTSPKLDTLPFNLICYLVEILKVGMVSLSHIMYLIVQLIYGSQNVQSSLSPK